MEKEYEYESVISLCSKGSTLDSSLQTLQKQLVTYYTLLKECESKFHGIGYKSEYYKIYDEIYHFIGQSNRGGCWDNIKETIEILSKVKSKAENDLDAYEEALKELNNEEINI